MPTVRTRRLAIAPASAPPAAARPLLLVVDPDDRAREQRAGALGGGFRLAHARTGFEAIVKASCHRPDLIVMRSLEPGPDGLDHDDTAELLRQCPSTAHIPVLQLRQLPIDGEVLRRNIEAALDAVRLP